MSYKLKTLIVFDTNSLRSTEAGEVAYSTFYFGRPFQAIEEFITENKLTEDVQIAIPTWAIEELKDQKQRQYKTDIEAFQKLSIRLSGIPDIPEIKLPEGQFDCAAYVEGKALEYLDSKKIMLLEIKEEIANTVLQSMMKRVMKDESKKKPFSHSGKFKDAGFKDNIVWESLMHFEGLTDYDKVIFLTKDGDYKNCEIEFKAKWQKHITILQDENNVLVDIQKDYDNYIKERVIHDFAQTEYFTDYLKDDLKVKTIIVIEDEEYKIENFAIVDSCKNVDRMLPNEEEVENITILSKIAIHFTNKGEKKIQIVEASTTLEDEETKEIVSTEYNFELK
ncbi:hypothetical protein SAMN05421821_11183 [Mucilaginibacter lappiensis]|uniref:DUF4935 domain-containing protein n=1 Tax=Mucilaginibacter lappiensis TaxID=354630 RepID=A0ABR6PNB9_9SPHI|nr:PIN domain-containing protein [Mucilaginibacter lappiensis]MBB6111273.1 hypothetical protein [Mucilaginibacter lappiensis]SIR74375.1 hypothetical protein SAMN05421821_11183 [Mucilaginibacter lappiensis]